MDLREQKTKRSIRNAFLDLRARKPLERITIKELAELAQISKATFYLHYQDIYDLSSRMQDDVIRRILDSIERPDLFVEDPTRFTLQLFEAFNAQQNIIDILFSGTQASVLPIRIEAALKEHIFSILPDTRRDARFQISLTYQILGGYYAYTENRKLFGDACVMEALEEIVGLLHPDAGRETTTKR